MSTVEEQLDQLQRSWDVFLRNDPSTPGRWILTLEGEPSHHVYRGTLASVVGRAWAGERGDS